MERSLEIKKAETGAWISIIAYTLLSLLKLIVGYIGNSEALRADGLNNTTDVVVSVAVLIGLRISRKPADENHLYGHYRAESVSSLIAAIIMTVVGLQIIVNAGRSFLLSEYSQPDMLTAWTALFGAIVLLLVFLHNRKLAKELHSSSLMAAAQDSKSDALVSVGAFVGIIGAKVGLLWLDSFTAIIVGIIIIKTALSIFREASVLLTDGFDEKKLELLRNTVADTNGVLDVRDIKAREHGNKVYVDTTILVNPKLNVVESHKITEDIEKKMLLEHKNTFVHVHIEPYELK
ncbi:cation diffusion facilitator family transporter [Bacillus sp. 1NLA3E]|uniref:cation diffusion facilitator family transporter n=1 Tax=Bacillus sp. 1NLA3E TaxID=666686 RepID=UPI000247F264|nr:cation diffusion facilitator family transporter [Bacillus sp. 1NLA3E]AGK55529.1 cation efflux system [Bacillus sp. 1NLA3E]